MTMSLCQSFQHSFLGLKNTATVDDDDAAYRSPSPSPSPSPATESPLFTFPSVFSKKDPGGIGFIDDMGGGVDGLMSCTESLGFESSDERIDHHQMEDMDHAGTNCNRSSSNPRWRKYHHDRDRDRDDREVVKKKFPPPISSMNGNGQHSFFLRSVTSDGRLELTEVRIDKQEILRASREDGRLRLHLIRDYEDEQDDEETLDEEDDDDEETLEEEEEEEEGRVGEWKLEGFRRCNEMMGHHHHHHHHHHPHHHRHSCVWNQQCVPTR